MVIIGQKILNTNDFYITEKPNGLNTLTFNMSADDDLYTYESIREEAQIMEGSEAYRIKSINDSGSGKVTITAEIDLNEWKATLVREYKPTSVQSMAATLNANKPSGWTILDQTQVTKNRKPSFENVTAFDILQECVTLYGFAIKINQKSKQVIILNPANYSASAYIMEGLNLTKLGYKGSSSEFATRLYCKGADGMTFADINQGKDYVEYKEYYAGTICAYWEDSRYTDKASLLADAQKKIKELGTPEIEYTVSIKDLAAMSQEYDFLTMGLLSVVRIHDQKRKTSIDMQCIEYKRYPAKPESNELTLSNRVEVVKGTIASIKDTITDTQEEQRTAVQIALEKLAEEISEAGGLFTTVQSTGSGDIIYLHNKETLASSPIVWKMTADAFAVSTDGQQTWNAGLTADGTAVLNRIYAQGIDADYINTGVLSANRIAAGSLTADKIKADETFTQKLTANDFHMNGGSISIGTSSADLDVIMLNYQTYTTAMSSQSFRAEDSSGVSELFGSSVISAEKKASGDGMESLLTPGALTLYQNMKAPSTHYAQLLPNSLYFFDTDATAKSSYGYDCKIGGVAEIKDTLTLSKTQDASGTADNKPALIVGGTSSQQHLEMDGNELMSKANATTPGNLAINADGGAVYVGNLNTNNDTILCVGQKTSATDGKQGVVVAGSGAVEISGATPYIDFHFNNSTSDYTSRIVEEASGRLKVEKDFKLAGYHNYVPYGATSSSQVFPNTAANVWCNILNLTVRGANPNVPVTVEIVARSGRKGSIELALANNSTTSSAVLNYLYSTGNLGEIRYMISGPTIIFYMQTPSTYERLSLTIKTSDYMKDRIAVEYPETQSSSISPTAVTVGHMGNQDAFTGKQTGLSLASSELTVFNVKVPTIAIGSNPLLFATANKPNVLAFLYNVVEASGTTTVNIGVQNLTTAATTGIQVNYSIIRGE